MKLQSFILISLATYVAAKPHDTYRTAVAVTAQSASGGGGGAQRSPQYAVKNMVQRLDNEEMDVEIEVNKDLSSGPLVFSISSDDHSCSFSFDSLQGRSVVSDSKFRQINGILFGTSADIPDALKKNAELMQQIDCFKFLYESLVAANSDTSDAIREFIVSQFYSQFMEAQTETASISALNVMTPAQAQWMKVNTSEKKRVAEADQDNEGAEDGANEEDGANDEDGAKQEDGASDDEAEASDPSDAAPITEEELGNMTKIGYINKVSVLNNFDKINDVEYIGSIDTVTYIDELREITNVGSIDNVERIENIADIKHTGNMKNIVNVGIIREIETLEDIKHIENVSKIENIKSLESLEDLAKIEFIDNIESIKNVENLEDVQNINNVGRINNIEIISIFSVPTDDEQQFTATSVSNFEKSDIQNVEVIENIQRVDNLRNLKNIGYIEDIKNIESVEHSKNMEAENVGTIENIEYVTNVEELLPPVQEEAYMDFNIDECDGDEAEFLAQPVSIQAFSASEPSMSKHVRPIFVSKGSIENIEKVKNVEYMNDPAYIKGIKHIEKIHNVEVIANIDNPKHIDDIDVIENVGVIKNINIMNSDQQSAAMGGAGSPVGLAVHKKEVRPAAVDAVDAVDADVPYTGLRVQKVKQATSAAATVGNETHVGNGTVVQRGAAGHATLVPLGLVPALLLALTMVLAL